MHNYALEMFSGSMIISYFLKIYSVTKEFYMKYCLQIMLIHSNDEKKDLINL